MTNPLIRAFFIGRAAADLLSEQVEDKLTDLLSEVGKFEAEQRENLRIFTDTVLERAATKEAEASEDLKDSVNSATANAAEDDVQAIVDRLRAEVAQLRSELQRYRTTT